MNIHPVIRIITSFDMSICQLFSCKILFTNIEINFGNCLKIITALKTPCEQRLVNLKTSFRQKSYTTDSAISPEISIDMKVKTAILDINPFLLPNLVPNLTLLQMI